MKQALLTAVGLIIGFGLANYVYALANDDWSNAMHWAVTTTAYEAIVLAVFILLNLNQFMRKNSAQ